MDALYVNKGFTDFILEKTKNPKHIQQRNFLLRHERRHIAEQNVMKEVKTASLRLGPRFQRKQLDMLIRAGASIFCDCAIAAKIKELMTEAELKRQEQNSEEARMADAQDMVNQMEKEAMSTAITKAMPGFRDAENTDTGAGEDSGLGDDRVNGPALQPSGGDPASPGND